MLDKLFGILAELEVVVLDAASEAAEAAEAAAAKKATEDAAAKKATEDAAAKKAAEDAAANKSFTQEDVNTALAKQKRENQIANTKIIEELEAVKAKAELSKTERDELDVRIKAMKQANMTKEELAKQDRLTTDSEHEAAVITLTTERDIWKNRYTNETISRSIVDASVEHDAVSPEQIIAILQSKTQLEETQDGEGKKTGRYEPMVDLDVIDDAGQTKTLHLTPSAAVKKMREIEKYQNLFNAKGTGGLHQYNRSAGSGDKGQVDMQKLAQDPVAYREAREKEKKEGKT